MADEAPTPDDQQVLTAEPPAEWSSSVAAVLRDAEAGPSVVATALTTQVQKLDVSSASKKKPKDKYNFWETQPVQQFTAEPAAPATANGPIDPPKTPADVRQEPYNLPPTFEWSVCDFQTEAVIREVYELLSNNYVEDDDAMFRFNYSPAFLKWALQPPGFIPDWLLGVRVKANQKLVGFISGVPADVCVDGKVIRMAEINFLCVHKKLRSKRLAPVLIKEITRRVNLLDIWQASYTAGVVLPKPIATCRYWHRSLNPKKLVDIGFSRIQSRMTMTRTIKLYKLPEKPTTVGLRPFEAKDAEQVTALLNAYLSRFRLHQVFHTEEVGHWFVPQNNVIDAWVLEDAASGRITDMVSFYSLPSTILGHPVHNELKAAYMYYTVPGAISMEQLLTDAMILAHGKGYDVYNALDLMENSLEPGATEVKADKSLLRDLKFGQGDGQLHYYLFNWAVHQPMLAQDVGLVLM